MESPARNVLATDYEARNERYAVKVQVTSLPSLSGNDGWWGSASSPTDLDRSPSCSMSLLVLVLSL